MKDDDDDVCCDFDNVCPVPCQTGLPGLDYDEGAESVELKLNNPEAARRAKERRIEIEKRAAEEANSKKQKTKAKKKATSIFPSISQSLSGSFQRDKRNIDDHSKSTKSKSIKSKKPKANSKKTENPNVISKQSPTALSETKNDYATDMLDSDLEENKIKAHVMMISGCDDAQTSADVSNVVNFSLPDPNGKAGGACTSALLKVLYNRQDKSTNVSFVHLLTRMRYILRKGSYTQIPQLSSSRPVDLRQPFYIVPPNCQGTRRAVLIGINYHGQNGELSGCHNDCLNMKKYITEVWGFQEENVHVLMDDGQHLEPTKANILGAFKDIAATSKRGDAVFCHYSGHGGRVRDDDWGEEKDGYDETLVPVDYNSAGLIRDDDLHANLICALARGVTMVALMDCCHSGTVLDLPYKYKSNSTLAGDEITFFDTKTQWVICNDPLMPLICLFMVIVFCAVFFPMMYA